MRRGDRANRILDPELTRLRSEWVAAYRAWIQVADGLSPTSPKLTSEQHAALRRYHAAQAAYFIHHRMLTSDLEAS